jgi:hypothetical protein
MMNQKEKWKKLVEKKPTNIKSILDLLAPNLVTFNHINPYSFRARTPAGVKAPRLPLSGSQLDVQGIARGIIWTPVLFKSVAWFKQSILSS